MRSRGILLVTVTLAVLLVGAAVVYGYDESRRDQIARGVSIAGVPVGGLDSDEARVRLQERVVAPLRRSVVVRAGDRRFRLTAREARLEVNVGDLVTQALAVSRDGNLLTRTWRSVTGGEVDRSLAPRVTYSRAAVQRLVDRVRLRSEREARNADVEITLTSVRLTKGRTGRTIDAKALKRRVEAVLLDGTAERSLRAKLEVVQPEVTTAEVRRRHPSVVTVDRSGYTLRLFRDLELVKTYRIAVGQAGLETPAGRYEIQNMAVDPAWHVPNSDWAGELAGQIIPPGPENPIKARWMGIYDGAGIHGTDARDSIGTNASHGCIRMLVEDVEELYEQVDVGTPVLIA
jgi:lipoprotein-anchoring transpeptidase ErfK/SrfK